MTGAEGASGARDRPGPDSGRCSDPQGDRPLGAPDGPRGEPLVFVLFGPGGAGKGTVAAALIAADPRLWLSRSWTTRQRRPGEPPDAYTFVDLPTFEAAAAAGEFFEWAEFMGHLYGTPLPHPPSGRDVLLEIDVQGARQVRQARPDAVLILLVPPSPDVQEARLRGRGDPEGRVAERVRAGAAEVSEGRRLADAVVVNDDLDTAVAEVAGILENRRRGAGPAAGGASPTTTRGTA